MNSNPMFSKFNVFFVILIIQIQMTEEELINFRAEDTIQYTLKIAQQPTVDSLMPELFSNPKKFIISKLTKSLFPRPINYHSVIDENIQLEGTLGCSFSAFTNDIPLNCTKSNAVENKICLKFNEDQAKEVIVQSCIQPCTNRTAMV